VRRPTCYATCDVSRVACLSLLIVAGSAATVLPLPVETLKPVSALPAHLAGALEEVTVCEQSADGTYFIFDRRSHAVFSVPPSREAVRPVIQIGREAGRILRPTAFDLADDETFVVADAPGSRGRIQVFHFTGASLGGFLLSGREVPLIVLDGLVMNGIGSLEYTGQSVLISQPESGALITEYALDGRILRTFGTLRRSGHEQDPQVHLALNAGLIVLNPRGGLYYVFVAGAPMFRKYSSDGTLVFERHIEGVELDEYMSSFPTVWPMRRADDGTELPVVRPAVRAAGADADGNLWVSLSVPYSYVYDSSGDKRRTVQFRAAGILTPTSLSFTRKGQVLVSPGCYAF
jgi:hypothetical protein